MPYAKFDEHLYKFFYKTDILYQFNLKNNRNEEATLKRKYLIN